MAVERSDEYTMLMEGTDRPLHRVNVQDELPLSGSVLMYDAEMMQQHIIDRYVPASKLRVVLGESTPFSTGLPKLRIGQGFGSAEYAFTSTSFAQLCEKSGAGVTSYMKKCITSGLGALVPLNLNKWLGTQGDREFMLRLHEGSVIAVLSNRYGVFDHFDALDCLADALERHTEGQQRYAVDAYALTLDNMNVRLVDTEKVVLNDQSYGRDESTAGLIFRNGQTGQSFASVEFLVYTFACTNGLIVSQDRGAVFRRRHINIDKVSFRDQLVMALEKFPAYVEAARKDMEAARAVRLNPGKLESMVPTLQSDLGLSEDEVGKLFLVMENQWDRNVWGLAGAITEVAQQFTAERQYQFEKYAGELVQRMAA